MKPLLATIRKNSICAWESDFCPDPQSPSAKTKDPMNPIKKQNLKKLDIHSININIPVYSSNKSQENSHFSHSRKHKTQVLDSLKRQKSKSSNMTLPHAIQIELHKSFFIWDKPDPLSIWGFRGLSLGPNHQRLCKPDQLQSTRSQLGTRQGRRIRNKQSKTQTIMAQQKYFDQVQAVKKLVSYGSEKKRRSVCISLSDTFDSSNQTKYIKRSWKNRFRPNSTVLEK